MSDEPESAITRFLKWESAGGIVLMCAAALALLSANSPLYKYYALILDTPMVVSVGDFAIAKPLLLWVNDGVMAIFFLLIGLELKREVLEGEMSSLRQIALPGLGAIGGMAIPAIIYVTVNRGDALAMRGWAIPTATDIAFALGILSLLGSRVPTSLKVFLTSLSIFDDIGAIVIIAIFYSHGVSLIALSVAAGCLIVLFYLNRRQVMGPSLYIVVGLVLWVALLKSGVHATLAGVILAMFIPLKSDSNPGVSLLKAMEQDLHMTVAFVVLPVFAFCNAGIRIIGISPDAALHGVPLGIALGLFVGKPLGVWVFCWLGIKLHVADLPNRVSWTHLFGVAALCGVGFTMSLFISSLAFEASAVDLIFDERLGIIIGSILSGVLGYVLLYYGLPRSKKRET